MTRKKTVYVEEKQDANTRLTRWNACQMIMTRIYHSEIATSDLIDMADETQTEKTLGFVKRRIGEK